MELDFVKKIISDVDRVEKYIFKTHDGFIVELSYIDNGTGKDIICVPTHTMCDMGCKFCHTTDYIGKISSLELRMWEIFDGVEYIIKDLHLKNDKTLLISYMGCGEPLKNVDNVIRSMCKIKDNNPGRYVRFAIATSLPKKDWENFFILTRMIKDKKLDVKMHFSLHYTNDEIRKKWMPNSLEIKPSLSAMSFYHELTGNQVEIHYALIDGVNDNFSNAFGLVRLLKSREFNVKFLFYNEKETIDAHASNKEKYEEFSKFMNGYGISTEYYIPPGLSIGDSCGAFLMDRYLELKND